MGLLFLLKTKTITHSQGNNKSFIYLLFAGLIMLLIDDKKTVLQLHVNIIFNKRNNHFSF